MLTVDQRNEITALAERGIKCGQIAQRTGISRSRVYLFMATNGLHAAKLRDRQFTRLGKPFKTFSPDEDSYIEALRVQGYTCAQIGHWCGRRFGYPRTAGTISIRLRMLASAAALKDA